MHLFAGVGAALSAFIVVLLVAIGLFGVMLAIVVLAACWIPGCVLVAADARWEGPAAWWLAGVTAAGIVAAIVTGVVTDPIGGNVLALIGLAVFFWARQERRAAKRRKLLAAIARQRAAQEARRAARAARVERWTSLVRPKGIEMPRPPEGGRGKLRKVLLSSVGELDRLLGHREHDVE